MNEIVMKVRPVHRKECVDYRCTRCGNCCKHAKAIMLSPLDIIKLTKHFRQSGFVHTEIEDVCNQYTEPLLLTDYYPVLTLRTVGDEDTCIFLREGKCSVYPVRPRICRLYPISVEAIPEKSDFAYYLCEDHTHHLTGGKIRVKEWLRKNFDRDDQAYMLLETKYIKLFHEETEKLSPAAQEKAMAMVIFYLYFNYDLNQPFLPQYEQKCLSLIDLICGMR